MTDHPAELPAVEAAMDWLLRVHDSDPSQKRLKIVRAALEAAEREPVDEAREAGYWAGFAEGKAEAETRDLNFDELTETNSKLLAAFKREHEWRMEAEAENQRLCGGIEALIGVAADSSCIHLNDLYGRLRALLSASSVRGEAARSWLCSQCGERESVMVKIGTDDGWCTACLDEAADCPDCNPTPSDREEQR